MRPKSQDLRRFPINTKRRKGKYEFNLKEDQNLLLTGF